MNPHRSSNVERANFRKQCRQKLSEHIHSKLGILIEPADVRLITGPADPYTWKTLPEKKHLFEKHLSKHSIGAYRELCRGVGVAFEAIPTYTLSDPNEGGSLGHGAETMTVCSSSEASFTTVIGELESQSTRLTLELRETNNRVADAEQLVRQSKEESERLHSILQAVMIDNQRLQQEVTRLIGLVEVFRSTTVQTVDEFAMRIKLQLEIPSAEYSIPVDQ